MVEKGRISAPFLCWQDGIYCATKGFRFVIMKRLILLIGCCVAINAQAEIYKHVDASGNITYTDYPVAGAKRLHIGASGAEWSNVHKLSRSRPMATSASVSIPRIDSGVQNKRDDLRRSVLENELKTEQQALTEARQAQQKAESTPSGGSGANAARAGKLDEAVKLHQDNVDALGRELSRIH